MNSRSIPPHLWEHARGALLMFFRQRIGSIHAEDLAQETLATIWRRSDFEFDKEDDFIRVCHGFAKHILKWEYRRSKRFPACAEDVGRLAAEQESIGGLEGYEVSVYLDEIMRIGEEAVGKKDWSLILGVLEGGREDLTELLELGTRNNLRVRLFRTRRKLAALTGWRIDRL